MKILITGVGGSGKTTIIEELSKRGNIGIDLDNTNLCFWINKQTGKRAEYVEDSGADWLKDHSWRLDVEGLQNFMKTFPSNENLYIGGKIAKSQIGEVKEFFDKIFLLRPSDAVLSHRQHTRVNKENKFAKSKSEQEYILKTRKEFEEECLKSGAILIDADKSIEDILNKIILSVIQAKTKDAI